MITNWAGCSKFRENSTNCSFGRKFQLIREKYDEQKENFDDKYDVDVEHERQKMSAK